jgi:hypothetical protein
MKAIIVGVFALAVCWMISHFVNLGHTVTSLAGVPISGGVILFCISAGLVYGKVK